MKRSSKLFSLCLFAVLLSGCLPQEKLTGRVIDTGGPVPEAAVLGMVWIEDADKTKPAPDTKDLKSEDRDAAMEKDMKDRGLPVAYARVFSDKNGWFTLDNFHFSAETKKAVKAMKQPKITRVTMWVFQRGYRKQAVTVFPKNTTRELPTATIILFKPESWKELALDSSYRMLKRDEYDAGYSKEFGATKEEKAWFLEYTNSNLNKAYAESNIKGDKIWEEDCGHDYSDIIVSTAGMQRNPAREKCNRLLHQMGVLREWKKEWLAHSQEISGKTEPHISAIKTALDALGPEYAEVKANEGYIIAGVEEAEFQQRKSQTNQDMRNGLNDSGTRIEVAQQLYNIGDKAGAYKALGGVLYSQMPDEVREGPLTAQLTIKTMPGITDAVSGFYLLMNRPLTAQLPGNDGRNHKDKPGYKVEEATETVGEGATTKSPSATKEDSTPKIIKLGIDDVNIGEIRANIGLKISKKEVPEIFDGHEAARTITKKAYHTPNFGYFLKVENNFVESGDQIDEVKAKLELYTENGLKVLDKELTGGEVRSAVFLNNGIFLVELEMNLPSYYIKQAIYNSRGELLYESQNIENPVTSPQGDYLLFLEKAGDGVNIKKMDLQGNLKLVIKIDKSIGGIESISNDGRSFIAFDGREIAEADLPGKKYWEHVFMYFKDEKLIWTKTLKVDGSSHGDLSKTAKYLIIDYEADRPCVDKISEGKKHRFCKRGTDRFKIWDTTTQDTIYDGIKNDVLIQSYKDEVLDTKEQRPK